MEMDERSVTRGKEEGFYLFLNYNLLLLLNNDRFCTNGLLIRCGMKFKKS